MGQDAGVVLDVVGDEVIFFAKGGGDGAGAGEEVADLVAFEVDIPDGGDYEVQDGLFRAHVFDNVGDTVFKGYRF